ncbi:MAG: hypothetical protein ACXQTP_03285, partial [Candidatus Methanofastidiosia archaeon]
MEKKDIYSRIMKILLERYEKEPLYYVPSSELRARLDVSSADELRPFVESLAKKKHIKKIEGRAPETFLVKITKEG